MLMGVCTVRWQFIEAAKHRSGNTSKQQYIEAATHRSSNTLKRHFIKKSKILPTVLKIR
jgi:hypothetical protein